jgi:transcriptional regulator with XRE-family HTH domain
MDEDLRRIFSENLNYWLERRGKTQADLYKKMAVTSATASDWCNGKKTPRVDKIVDIAIWLMIEVTDLITIKERVDDITNDIQFRFRDDDKFKNIVIEINSYSEDDLDKLQDYMELLSRRG